MATGRIRTEPRSAGAEVTDLPLTERRLQMTCLKLTLAAALLAFAPAAYTLAVDSPVVRGVTIIAGDTFVVQLPRPGSRSAWT